MRDELAAEIEEAILEMEEIGSRIQVIRFAEHPEREIDACIDEITAAVGGLCDGLESAGSPQQQVEWEGDESFERIEASR
jgi:hypothetical protein